MVSRLLTKLHFLTDNSEVNAPFVSQSSVRSNTDCACAVKALKKKKAKADDIENSRIQKLILKFSLRNRLSQVSDDYQNRRSAGWDVKTKENPDEYIDPDWDGSSAGDSVKELMGI